jgi:hypothetical protein
MLEALLGDSLGAVGVLFVGILVAFSEPITSLRSIRERVRLVFSS